MNNLSLKQKRQLRGIITMVVTISVFFIFFYLKSTKIEDVTFGFIVGEEWKLINEWIIDSKNGVLIFLLKSSIAAALDGIVRTLNPYSFNTA